MRGTYFQGTVTTLLRVDSTGATTPDGTSLSGEDDPGFDDVVDQGRMESDVRMAERSHVRSDYSKLNRFSQQELPRDIEFGDFSFAAGDTFRGRLDWRMLGITYTGSVFTFERFGAGFGLGLHILEAHAEGSEPGTLDHESDSEASILPTIALNGGFRISKRRAVTARGQSFSASADGFDGTLSDYHAEVQYHWRKKCAAELGYSKIEVELNVIDADQPLLFNMDTSGPGLSFRASF